MLEVMSLFFFFTHTFEKRKGHNMLAITLDPKFKSMCLVTTYVACDNVIVLIAKYDNELLLPLLTEVYKLSMSTILEKPHESPKYRKQKFALHYKHNYRHFEGPCWLRVVHLSLISY